MRYFRVKNFSGIQNQAEETDQDRGSLTICENAVPYPKGSLRSAPMWKRVYENLTLPSDSLAYCLDSNGHKVVVTKNGSDVHGLAWVSNSTSVDKLPANASVVTATDNTLTGAFINRVGSELFVGDGVNANLRWGQATNYAFSALQQQPDKLYAQAAEIFPSCTSFVVGPDKAIYATGNSADPMAVYVSEPATIANPDVEDALQGIYSGVMSTVNIIMSEASRITALSTFRNYVVVHTDVGVALLYRTEKQQAGTGYRVRQTASPTVSGALNPNSASANMGVRPFYLGTDGQIYKDEAARAGQDHTTEGRLKEIISWKAVNAWNRHVDVNLTGSFTAYEPSAEFFSVCVPHLSTGVSKGYPMFLYNGETFALSGPNLYPRFQAVTRIDGTSALLGIDQDQNFWMTDFTDLRETSNFNDPYPTPPANVKPNVYLKYSNTPSSTKVLASNSNLPIQTRQGFVQIGGNSAEQLDLFYEGEGSVDAMNYAGAFSKPVEGALPASIGDYQKFSQSTVSVIETSYEDMGAPESMKNFMEVFLKFKTGSLGFLGVYAQTEDGLESGKWVGEIMDDEIKVFLNMRGKQLKVRLYIIAPTNASWFLKDFEVGYLLQNTL